MKHRLWLFFLLYISAFSAAVGQTVSDSVQIRFRQSKVNVDPTYMQNDASFRHIRNSALFTSDHDSLLTLRRVDVVGGASPEGSIRFNEWLSAQRAARIREYLSKQMIVPDSLTSLVLLGRDWEGLRRMVIADPDVPSRNEVISALDDIIAKYRRGERENDHNLLRLKSIAGGAPYIYLYRYLFPALRESKVVLVYDVNMPPLSVAFAHIVGASPVPEPSDLCIPTAAPSDEHNFYMALKTNLICDLLSLPEIGAEFYLGKNFSVVANWMYGWWDKDSSHRYWRAYGGDLAFRWWFGRKALEKPLTGHHVGIFGGVVTYDFEFGGEGKMGGRPGHSIWDRCMHYAGVEYGYSLPIARRLNLDFTLGLGYLGGKYVEYVPKGHCYEWQATKYKNWVGPTKIEVSLTWLIGHGNYNKKGASK